MLYVVVALCWLSLHEPVCPDMRKPLVEFYRDRDRAVDRYSELISGDSFSVGQARIFRIGQDRSFKMVVDELDILPASSVDLKTQSTKVR